MNTARKLRKMSLSIVPAILLMALVLFSLPRMNSARANGTDLIITGVVDGPLTGGLPKAVEFYVLNDIADLSDYGFGSASNGGGTDGEEFTFPAVSATAGDFIYVATEATGFNNFFGFSPDYTDNLAPSINGDDAIELFYLDSVVDVFGEINQDGSGQPWEYLDGWAYRVDGTGPDGTTFVLFNWTFSGPNALDGETSNETARVPFPIGSYQATTYGVTISKVVTPTTGVDYHGTVTYTVVISNSTAVSDTNALLSDTLPANTTFGSWIEQPDGVSESGGEITWGGTLTNNTAITFAFTAIHTGDYGDVIVNTAEYNGSVVIFDSATFIVVAPDLTIGKTVMPSTNVTRGGTVTYTILVTNSGGVATNGVVLTDTLPAEADLSGWVISQTATMVSDDTITWSGDVASGETLSWTFSAEVSGTFGSAIVNTATIEHDGNLAEDSAAFVFETEIITGVIINELDADQADEDAEFIELYDGGAGNTSLTGMVVVLYNGSGDVSYNAFDLDGFSTNANGYFVIGTPGVPGVDMYVIPGEGGWLQNGADAAAIYQADATDFPNDTAVTTDNLIDALVYDTNEADDAGLLVLLNTSQPQVDENGAGDKDNHSNQRCPNGSGGTRNTNTYAQFLPTPDAKNCDFPPQADLELNKTVAPTNNPDEGDTITYTLKLVSAAASTISATNVVIVDYLPDVTTDITYTHNTCGATVIGDTITWTVASLLLNTTETCDIVVQIRPGTDGDSIVNKAQVFASDQNDPDSTPGNMNGTLAEDDEAGVTVFVGTPVICGSGATPIHDIQGSGDASSDTGSIRTIEAVVVGDYQGTTDGLSGFFVQEEDADTDEDSMTSEGIFVYDSGFGVDVSVGDLVRVTGVVAEYVNLTELNNVTDVTLCGSGNSVTPAPVTLPISDVGAWEWVEGMLINFSQKLHVTENYNLGRYGQVHLSIDDHLYNPTNVTTPGAAANALQDLNDRSRVILDDANTNQNPDPIIYPDPGLSALNTLRGNYTVPSLTGVMDQYEDEYHVQPVGSVNLVAANPRTVAPDPIGGRLTVASFNVLNYFNGDGMGGGFPTPRGANSLSEFNRQRTKIITAVLSVDADVVGLMEIENDGYGANSAIQDLVNGLNAIAGAGTYALIDPGVTQIGTDEIAIGLIYQPSTVTPVGLAAILDSSFDPRFIDTKNRPALAQTFEENSTGERFTAAVNHLKSKGSACSGDPDMGDGQGNCNLTRTNAMTVETEWLATDPTGSGDPDFIIMGDLNAYAMEDPIVVAENAGYTDLLEQFVGPNAYSYVFYGQVGYLDYAMSNTSLTTQVTGATAWHINADEPRVLDYNEEFQSPGQVISLYNDDPYRASDHDPVIVGLTLGDGVPILTVDKRVEPVSDVPLDGIVTYTIVIRNDGWATAEGVVLTDVLPSKVDFGEWIVRGSAQPPDPVDDTITWGPWSVADGGSYTFTFSAIVTPPATYEDTVTNVAEFISGNAGSGFSNDAVFSTIAAPPLNLSASTKMVEPAGDVNAGDYLTYTVTLSNSGQADATVTITDTLPGELLLVSGFGGGTNTALTWSGLVAGEDQVELTLIVQADPSLTATVTVSNTVTIDDGVNAAFDIHSPDTTILVGGDGYYVYLPLVSRSP
ncbi:MAG: ExeM/NucH family extracellular endonuclease [Chloroflexi bacterium]|nr:ExeM/NucH family extracellular endonuclease [Chloroflexota bacterium]